MKLINALQITKTNYVPKLAVGVLVIFDLGMFVIGFDQCHLFNVADGPKVLDELYSHDLANDMRHTTVCPVASD